MKQRLLALARIALGGYVAYAAVSKLPDMAGFAESIANYRMLPSSFVPFFAAAVVGTEIVAGAALAVGVAARAAAAWTAIMLAAFTVALSQALLRGIDLACGCFGPADAELVSWWTVGRDAALLAVALVLARFGPGRLLPRRQPAGSDAPAAAI